MDTTAAQEPTGTRSTTGTPDPTGTGSAAGAGAPVLVSSPATVPAVRARLAGSADGTGYGPIVVVLVPRPAAMTVDVELDRLVRLAGGSLHLLVVDRRSGAALAGRLRWLVPDLATRAVRLLVPPGERSAARRLLRAAGARSMTVVGSPVDRSRAALAVA